MADEVLTTQEVQNKIIVCIDGSDYIRDYESLELTFDSSEADILNAIRPIIQEEKGVDIKDEDHGWLYKVRKSTDSKNVYILPNSVAG